jgi:hypothetical protein
MGGPKRRPRKSNNRTLFKIRRANRGRRPMYRSQVSRGPELTTGGAHTLLLHNRDEGTEVGWVDRLLVMMRLLMDAVNGWAVNGWVDGCGHE